MSSSSSTSNFISGPEYSLGAEIVRTLKLSKFSHILLWFCYGKEAEYLSCSPIVKVIKGIEFRTKLYQSGYNRLSKIQKKRYYLSYLRNL